MERRNGIHDSSSRLTSASTHSFSALLTLVHIVLSLNKCHHVVMFSRSLISVKRWHKRIPLAAVHRHTHLCVFAHAHCSMRILPVRAEIVWTSVILPQNCSSAHYNRGWCFNAAMTFSSLALRSCMLSTNCVDDPLQFKYWTNTERKLWN